MEGVTDGAVTGHSLDQYLSASVAVARPGLEQLTQPPGLDTDQEMVSANSNRASAPKANSTTKHIQTRAQTCQERQIRERENTQEREVDRAAANDELARNFEDPKLSDDRHDQRDLVSNVTAQSASSAWRQCLIHREAET